MIVTFVLFLVEKWFLNFFKNSTLSNMILYFHRFIFILTTFTGWEMYNLRDDSIIDCLHLWPTVYDCKSFQWVERKLSKTLIYDIELNCNSHLTLSMFSAHVTVLQVEVFHIPCSYVWNICFFCFVFLF